MFEEFEDPYPQWPNYASPDCGNKCCTWSMTPLCFPCAEQMLGKQELIRLYNLMHEVSWEQELAEEKKETNGWNALPNL